MYKEGFRLRLLLWYGKSPFRKTRLGPVTWKKNFPKKKPTSGRPVSSTCIPSKEGFSITITHKIPEHIDLTTARKYRVTEKIFRVTERGREKEPHVVVNKVFVRDLNEKVIRPNHTPPDDGTEPRARRMPYSLTRGRRSATAIDSSTLATPATTEEASAAARDDDNGVVGRGGGS